jgi:hypothetical protein
MKTQIQTAPVSGKNNVIATLQKFSTECRQIFGHLKERVTTQLANEFAGALQARLVRNAVNEASQLVAYTAFPALLFPTLAEEKVREAFTWASRHQMTRSDSLPMAA